MANTFPGLLAFVDRDERYLWGNENYRSWVGVDPARMVGMHGRDVLGADGWEVVRPHVARALAGEPVSFEVRMPYRTTTRDVRAEYIPQRDARGEMIGFVVQVHDVGALRSEIAQLRAATRRKDELLAILSHELRNPLAPIISGIEILEDEADTAPPATRQIYGILSRQAHHMRRLLDDMLEISRLSQGKVELQRRPTELRAILAQAIEVAHPLVRAKQHRLELELASQPLLVDADPARLVQVFANLLNNAAKYTDAGGTITLASAHDGDHAIVYVRDTGIGMTDAMIARAFELFEQDARARDHSQGGLGIGLTMVRSLVALHGGTVEAHSAGVGRGSELVVRLPLSRARLPAEGPRRTRPRPTTRQRVLVVDDNVDAAASLGHLLELQGHDVTLVNTSPEALTVATTGRFELILLDVGLPDMDGYELARRLRDAGLADTLIVAVTGYAGDEDTQRALAAGFDRHLVKPVAVDEIRALIAERAAP